MAANVPITEIGSARLGIAVAETLRRNRKITSTTSTDRQQQRLLHVVDGLANRCRAVDQRSSFTAGGISCRKMGSSALMRSTTSTVLVPGWR